MKPLEQLQRRGTNFIIYQKLRALGSISQAENTSCELLARVQRAHLLSQILK